MCRLSHSHWKSPKEGDLYICNWWTLPERVVGLGVHAYSSNLKTMQVIEGAGGHDDNDYIEDDDDDAG